jgi:hypothetical protein
MNDDDYHVDRLKLVHDVALAGGVIWMICRHWKGLLAMVLFFAVAQAIQHGFEKATAKDPAAVAITAWRADIISSYRQDACVAAVSWTNSDALPMRAKYCVCVAQNLSDGLSDGDVQSILAGNEMTQAFVNSVSVKCGNHS